MKKNVFKITLLLFGFGLFITACTGDPNSGIFYTKSMDGDSPYKVTANGADTLHTDSLIGFVEVGKTDSIPK